MIVECAHASMEFLDPARQKQHDVNQIFKRAQEHGTAWVTGTEAASGGGPLARMIFEAAKANGFKPWVPSLHTIDTDCWVAVNRKFYVPGSLRRDYIPVVPAGAANGQKWAARGLTIATFEHKQLGEFNVAASHYLVRAARMELLNRKIADTASEWARDVAKGTGLAFYHGDQNLDDKATDTFFGEPFTSLWDELGKYEDTGHGTYDVIASYDRDRRVRGVYVRALEDKRFPLFSDHFYTEGGFEIGRIRP